VKVLSAECLHAVVLFIVGKASTDAQATAQPNSKDAHNYAQVMAARVPSIPFDSTRKRENESSRFK
jgi:hypothetical protein